MTGRACPVTGKPLPAGYFIHPSLAEEIRADARLMPVLLPELHDYTLGLTKAVTDDAGIHTQPGSAFPLREVERCQQAVNGLRRAGQILRAATGDKPTPTAHATYADTMCRYYDGHEYHRTLTLNMRKIETILDHKTTRNTIVACTNCGHVANIRINAEYTCHHCHTTQDTATAEQYALVKARTVQATERLRRQLARHTTKPH